MKNKKTSLKSYNSVYPSSILESNLSYSSNYSSKLSQQLLSYYKERSVKLEKEFDELLEALNKVKCACDLSAQLQKELTIRTEEVSKLQKTNGDLQIHLFREKELNLKLSGEIDQLKIENYTNKKKINLLLKASGTTEKKFLHFITSSETKFVPSKLPPKLQKLKEEKEKKLLGEKISDETESSESNTEVDPQVLLLNNQLLASQMEEHIKISKDQINVLLKEKEISDEERKVERQRLQNEIEGMASKLKETQDLLCETTKKLIKVQQTLDKEKTAWEEEKDVYWQAITTLKHKLGEDVPDIINYCLNGVQNSQRMQSSRERIKDRILEKEQMAAAYQNQILILEAEVNRLRERAIICRNIFKEKTEKMTAQVTYLKSKYEDLDRRRHLEAEGFRTDIRMLRDRLKELEKKLAKNSNGQQTTEHQQLLISARNTLNRAKQLEKELAHMKSKIVALEQNEDTGE